MPVSVSENADTSDQYGLYQSSSAPKTPIQPITLAKIRSTTNVLPSGAGTPAAAVAAKHDLFMLPTAQEHEHGLASSGLNRIRQPPPVPRYGGAVAHSSSITPTSPSDNATGKASFESTSPSLTMGDDFTRFPSESLHSFSFAHQSESSIHTRHNVLKRSVEFLRNRMAWAAGGLGIASAQARVSGDQEVQSMMELLSRAEIMGSDEFSMRARQGALTGPAEAFGDNVFEKDFVERSECPKAYEEERPGNLPDHASDDSEQVQVAAAAIEQPLTPVLTSNSVLSHTSQPPRVSFDSSASASRFVLKRTYTDVASLSLQSKLTDALGQPYLAKDSSLLSPVSPLSFGGPAGAGPSFPSLTPQPHGRGAPASQCIFTTEVDAPWTMTAANDLACLIFGIHKADLRTTSILEIIRDDRRKWLEQRLAFTGQGAPSTPRTPTSPRRTPSPSTHSLMGNGLTARLLSKPPSRETSQNRRTQSVDGGRTMVPNVQSKAFANKGSRGIILCGDVITIQKRDATTGSATLWLQEKRNVLIWVFEEIAEDVAYLKVDEVGCITHASGASEAVWGMARVRRGMDITRLVPGIPRLKYTNTGALDYDKVAELRRFTARTANDISVPVTVDQLSGDSTFRVSSFPYIAGMMFLSPSSLKVSSCNSAVSEALFGWVPNGMPMTDLIPNFDRMLELLVDDEKVALVEGMVIPEHSFRRARAMLAVRDGKGDAAAVFLRPSGLPAKHRDGADIMIDVQMRVVKSEAFHHTVDYPIMEEQSDDGDFANLGSSPKVAYALWVTYSRTLHAENHGIGPITPIVSRPSTPPHQPPPGRTGPVFNQDSDSDSTNLGRLTPSSSSQSSQEVGLSRSSKTPNLTDGTSESSDASTVSKKSINDFIILEDMGAGAYGQVKLARPRSGGSGKVVIKYVTKRRILVDTWTRDRRLGTVPLEIHVLDYLRRDGFRHPNIVEMADFFEDDVNYYIEMLPHGLPGMDLFDYIELRVNMAEAECRRIFRQVASAVAFLHGTAKVVHRDIKDENVVLDGEGNVKLIDFGSASYIKNGPFDVFVGTIDYAAPEVLAGHPYAGPAQDVWALGILLYTILYKENPFYSIDEIMDHDLRVPFLVSEESIDLVRKMLERDVNKRVVIEDVVGHVWAREDA